MSILQALIAAKLSGSGGGSVTVDASLSASSENPVQNKAISAALDEKGTYSKPSGGIPKTDLANAVQTSLEKADSALQSAPVSSVNGKTGAVVLDAGDVGALPEGTVIPSQIGQLSDNVGLVHYNSQTLTDAQKAQARTNIGAASMSDLGTVFTLKGGVATVNDLPQTGNSIGDVWYVESVSAGFIWITSTSYPNGYWEELGETIDMSAYIEKPANPQTGYVITWNGSAWVAAAVPTELPSVTSADNGKFLRVVSGAWAAQAVPAAESNSFGGGS